MRGRWCSVIGTAHSRSTVIGFEAITDEDFGFKLLGMPAMTEGYEDENEGMMSLLQLDEEERWGLFLHSS